MQECLLGHPFGERGQHVRHLGGMGEQGGARILRGTGQVGGGDVAAHGAGRPFEQGPMIRGQPVALPLDQPHHAVAVPLRRRQGLRRLGGLPRRLAFGQVETLPFRRPPFDLLSGIVGERVAQDGRQS